MRNAEVYIFLFIVGLLGVNWPMLEIFYRNEVLYLMTFWLLFILALVLAAHLPGKKTIKTGAPERQTP